MDNLTRLHCLKVMGIESWLFKSPLQLLPTVEIVSAAPVEKLPPPPFPPLITVAQSPTPVPVAPAPIAPAPIAVDRWQSLQQEVVACQKCSLCRTRTQTVFGSGNQEAHWLFIGEAPGEQEDLQGLPFVGTAGLLLTEMLRAIGLKRETVFIANILKCRPPQNRDPQVAEVAACTPYLQQQIALVKPKIIVAVGRIAAQHLLQTTETLAKLRGKVFQYQGIPLIVVYHPAFLLRSLTQKAKVWSDLQLAVKTYQQLGE